MSRFEVQKTGALYSCEEEAINYGFNKVDQAFTAVEHDVENIKSLVDETDKKTADQFNVLAHALNRIEGRLDQIERAIADPSGLAVDELREKHGLGKKVAQPFPGQQRTKI